MQAGTVRLIIARRQVSPYSRSMCLFRNRACERYAVEGQRTAPPCARGKSDLLGEGWDEGSRVFLKMVVR
jgi:hypothetical protein